MWTISNLCQTWIGAHQLWWTEPSNSNRNTFINRFRDHQHHKQDTDLCWKVLCTYQSCCRRCRHVIIERYIYITSAIFFFASGLLTLRHFGTQNFKRFRWKKISSLYPSETFWPLSSCKSNFAKLFDHFLPIVKLAKVGNGNGLENWFFRFSQIPKAPSLLCKGTFQKATWENSKNL